MKLIVGLGNPGAEYAGTRHNVGFEVIDELSRRHSISVAKRQFKAVLGEGTIDGERVILSRPMTYMNLSGDAVAEITRYYKIELSDIIVVLDDVALPIGRLRLRLQGSAGGHNGLANILDRLQSKEIARIRIGVGSPRPGQLVNHVLSRFSSDDVPLIKDAVQLASDSIELAVKSGFELAMNRFNLSPKPPSISDQD